MNHLCAIRARYRQDLSANPSRTAPTKLCIELDQPAPIPFKKKSPYTNPTHEKTWVTDRPRTTRPNGKRSSPPNALSKTSRLPSPDTITQTCLALTKTGKVNVTLLGGGFGPTTAR